MVTYHTLQAGPDGFQYIHRLVYGEFSFYIYIKIKTKDFEREREREESDLVDLTELSGFAWWKSLLMDGSFWSKSSLIIFFLYICVLSYIAHVALS